MKTAPEQWPHYTKPCSRRSTINRVKFVSGRGRPTSSYCLANSPSANSVNASITRQTAVLRPHSRRPVPFRDLLWYILQQRMMYRTYEEAYKNNDHWLIANLVYNAPGLLIYVHLQQVRGDGTQCQTLRRRSANSNSLIFICLQGGDGAT